jgi:hypothetical protein
VEAHAGVGAGTSPRLLSSKKVPSRSSEWCVEDSDEARLIASSSDSSFQPTTDSASNSILQLSTYISLLNIRLGNFLPPFNLGSARFGPPVWRGRFQELGPLSR